MTDSFERLRKEAEMEARAELTRDVKGWKANYAKLLGIADVVMGKQKGGKTANMVMARKLCSYYMRRLGYPYQTIANTVGLTSHATAMHHYKTCTNYLANGDWDYVLAHKQAQKMGIAV